MAILAVTNVTQAFNMGNMMNPGEWFDNNDRYDRYYGGRYGPYGYGGGPYGWGGYPGYGRPSTIVVNPPSGTAAPPPKLPE